FSCLLYFCHFFFFFFFQAEDGIRDLTVTGVQTCALPISCRFESDLGARGRTRTDMALRPGDFKSHASTISPPGRAQDMVGEMERSEERRVGKECRSRWAA